MKSLPDQIFTTEEISLVKQDLNVLYRIGFQDLATADEANLNSISPVTRALIDFFSPDHNPRQICTQIEQLLKRPVVQLSLAFEPTPDVIKNLGQKLQAQTKTDIILEIRHDPQIIGGLRLVWNGHVHDLSLASQLETTIAKYYSAN